MVAIALLQEDGHWRVLQRCASYDAADALLDELCEQYPHGYLEILPLETALRG